MRIHTHAGILFLTLLGCPIAACTSVVSSPTPSASSSGSGGAGGSGGEGGQGGIGPSCNGTPEQWCGDDAYCNAPANTCPGGGVTGTCTQQPKDCAGEQTQPVCGCDGKVYVNACLAYASYGIDVGSQDGCQPPTDAFQCGPLLCERGTTFCALSYGIINNAECKPLPPGCQAPDAMCNCLDAVLCFAAPGPPMCAKTAEGDFVVSCATTD